MATLETRGVWKNLEKLLAGDMVAAGSVERVAEVVRATCAKARGKAVYEVDEGDYWEQLLHDRHACYEMADSVNGAIGYDRDRAVDAVIALAPGPDPATYLRSVAACLDKHASSGGDYTARVLAGLLGDVVDAVRAGVEPKGAP